MCNGASGDHRLGGRSWARLVGPGNALVNKMAALRGLAPATIGVLLALVTNDGLTRALALLLAVLGVIQLARAARPG